MPATLAVEPGYLIAERYRVLRKLGEGGMGHVFLVRHVKTEERFALKILDPSVADTPSTRERFRREARAPARIDSDHVCRVLDTDIAEDLQGAPFLVMEYLRGRDFDELTAELGALPPREVVVYMRQLALVLDKAHAIGIIHRDLKPENLFLTTRDDGSPCLKVLDFGIAKLGGSAGDLAQVKATSTGDVFGTPLYMSPEQCLSEFEKVSAKTDVWAIGLITYRLLTGEDFWTANTLTHLIAQIAYDAIPKASARGGDFGAAFDAWFARCCARDVEERFPSAGEAVVALQDALGFDAESTGQLSTQLVAAAVAAAQGSRPELDSLVEGEVERDRALSKTSDALTVDPGSAGGGRWATVAAVSLLVGALGAAAVWWGVQEQDAPLSQPPSGEPTVNAAAPATDSGGAAPEAPAARAEPDEEQPEDAESAPTNVGGGEAQGAENATPVGTPPAAETTATATATPPAPPARPRPRASPPPAPPPPPPEDVLDSRR